MDTLSHSMVNLSKTETTPPYDELLETIAEMFDRMLTPEDGAGSEAGREVLRQFAMDAKTFFEKMNTPSKDNKSA
jgi:hypothetical protein